MSPLDHFRGVWARCDHLSVIHAYLETRVAPALQPNEILRAEWAARVSALDLYVHELVAQRMVAIFEGKLPSCPGFSAFTIPNETVERIRMAMSATDSSAAFDLTVREQLSRKTFQYPDDIASGVRLFSGVALWNEVAVHMGSTRKTMVEDAKKIKKELSQIVGRRNKIVHEGDLQPTIPRTPWPITQANIAFVTQLLSALVYAIDAVV